MSQTTGIVRTAVNDRADLMAIERTNEFRGVFHVLGGVISPMEGIGPEALRLRELVERIDKGGIREVILATNPTVEGDTTANQRIMANTRVVSEGA